MNELKEVLQIRGSNYGDFRSMSTVAQQLKHILIVNSMTDVQKESIAMIAVKLARIVCGDSGHRDSWLDISGYAALVVADIDRGSE